uniref:Uncharacterized protein n=1 Tax=Callithrix jacchus TaxID=9483 RepID=A0A8I3WAW5_CALJA
MKLTQQAGLVNTSCAVLARSLYLSGPQFTHLQQAGYMWVLGSATVQPETDPAARRPDPQTCASQDRLCGAPCTCHQPLASRHTHLGLVPSPRHDGLSVPQGPCVVQIDAAARMVELHAKNDTAVKTTRTLRSGKSPVSQAQEEKMDTAWAPGTPVQDRARMSVSRNRRSLPAGSTMAK